MSLDDDCLGNVVELEGMKRQPYGQACSLHSAWWLRCLYAKASIRIWALMIFPAMPQCIVMAAVLYEQRVTYSAVLRRVVAAAVAGDVLYRRMVEFAFDLRGAHGWRVDVVVVRGSSEDGSACCLQELVRRAIAGDAWFLLSDG